MHHSPYTTPAPIAKATISSTHAMPERRAGISDSRSSGNHFQATRKAHSPIHWVRLHPRQRSKEPATPTIAGSASASRTCGEYLLEFAHPQQPHTHRQQHREVVTQQRQRRRHRELHHAPPAWDRSRLARSTERPAKPSTRTDRRRAPPGNTKPVVDLLPRRRPSRSPRRVWVLAIRGRSPKPPEPWRCRPRPEQPQSHRAGAHHA